MQRNYLYNLLIIATALLITFGKAGAQAPVGNFSEYVLLPNKDTVMLDRQYGDWWYGGTIALNSNIFFNQLTLPLTFGEIDPLERTLDFPTGYGMSTSFGLNAEYLPVGKMWGANVRMFVYDSRSSETEAFPEDEFKGSKFKLTSNYWYFTLSPSARYNTKWTNFYLLGGFDLEFLMAKELTYKKEFINSAHIDWDRKLTIEPNAFRAGLHLGVGYDFFVLDVNHRVRVRISPYFTIHGGTNVFSDMGTSRNVFYMRGGVAIKFGPDKIFYDTLKYNPTYVPVPTDLASVYFERDVQLPQPIPFVPLVAEDLAKIEKPEPVIEPVDTLPDIAIDDELATSSQPGTGSSAQTEQEEKEKITIVKDEEEIFYFQKTLSSKHKEYLDALADYLKDNPRLRVRIVGHSDNTQSLKENQSSSEDRAQQVFDYLHKKKGLPRGRLLMRGVGAIYPIAPNNTESGRRKNRRVEITVGGK